jgi:hypothetical protein
MQITTIGLDIAKNVFQVHGIDANEKVVAVGQGWQISSACDRGRGLRGSAMKR